MFEERQKLNRYEKTIKNLSLGTKEFTSHISGVARATRLSRNYEDGHKQVIWDTASDVIGPLVFLLMWRTLEEAEKKGLKPNTPSRPTTPPATKPE